MLNMFFAKDNYQVTDITQGTTANYAYKIYEEKKRKIADLEYECELLIDKYHSEMCRAIIPGWFGQDNINDMFNDENKKYRDMARKHFLTCSFSSAFLEKHKVVFRNVSWHGYGRTAAGIVLAIGDYEYTIEIPLPQNILKEDDKKYLMGCVRFRVDRIHNSNTSEYVKTMESVQMPTYDWKKCFTAIEKAVEESATQEQSEVKADNKKKKQPKK